MTIGWFFFILTTCIEPLDTMRPSLGRGLPGQIQLDSIKCNHVSEVYKFFRNRVLASSRTFMFCRMVLMICLLCWSLPHHLMKTCTFDYIPGQRHGSRAWEDNVIVSILGTLRVTWNLKFTTSIESTHFFYRLKKIKFEKSQAYALLCISNIDQFSLSVNNTTISFKQS